MYRTANGVQTETDKTDRTTDRQSQLQKSFAPKNGVYHPQDLKIENHKLMDPICA